MASSAKSNELGTPPPKIKPKSCSVIIEGRPISARLPRPTRHPKIKAKKGSDAIEESPVPVRLTDAIEESPIPARLLRSTRHPKIEDKKGSDAIEESAIPARLLSPRCPPKIEGENRCKAIEESAIPAPLRFSSIRLNYISPLGNVAPPKKEKNNDNSASKKKQVHSSPVGNIKRITPSVRRRIRRKICQEADKLVNQLVNATVTAVTVDMPTQRDANGRNTFPIEANGFKNGLSPPKSKIPKAKKQKKGGRDSWVSHRTITIADSPSGNRCVRFADDEVDRNRGESRKRKNREGSPNGDEVVEIPLDTPSNKERRRTDGDLTEIISVVSATDSPPEKRQKVTLDEGRKNREGSPGCDEVVEIPLDAPPNKECQRPDQQDCDVTEITSDASAVDSPPDKRRKVTLGDGIGGVTVIVSNEATSKPMKGDGAHNETIDLEANETVTVLSDDEDTDVVVLGSPVVPSVRSYKEVATRWQQPPPVAATKLVLPQSIIDRALDKLKKMKRGPSTNAPNATLSMIDRAIDTLNQTTMTTSKRDSPARHQPSTSRRDSPARHQPSTSKSQPDEPTRSQVPPSPVNVYGGNLYNAGTKARKTGLRPIIIDASNVAMGHGQKRVFSCRGIEICVNYFRKRNHKVYAFLPRFRRHSIGTKDAHLLDKLEADNTLIFTPSRYVDGHSDVPYDDRYIVQTAAELGGVIVSTDNYRDLLRENPHWHDTIKNRLLMFTWVEDILIFPQDPLGRRGCRLEEFLRF